MPQVIMNDCLKKSLIEKTMQTKNNWERDFKAQGLNLTVHETTET